ncbi:L-aspartate oxidase [Asticcacaulis solisilvae]|uniref:L-aspartate oxidase n=1 Tax=Asticcacaulis solisilvae TaxID=1217274 RepID=UPI003FD89DCE
MALETYIHNGPLVIGAGLAGLSVALHAAPANVLMLAPVALGKACSSAWAQGGIAAALSTEDSPAEHERDTIAAGAGIVDPLAARTLTEMGPDVVRALDAMGAPFDHTPDGGFVLNREAAHGRARVARVGGDLAGKAILEAVVAKALEAPHIEIWEPAFALGLITATDGAVVGAVVEHESRRIAVYASAVVLASGGLGGLFAVTTNPANLRGEGMAMAALAGAVIADPEFVQFHPTALDFGRDPAPLATEALRGEGAILVDKNGVRFVLEDHPDGELAPRDIVARAVHKAKMSGRGAFLDATTTIGAHFADEFPTVFASCMNNSVDPRVEPMPVAPAAHYHMGGVATDIFGRTSLKGLYAAGECASTGVHGANRLASNSLLEAAAFGERVGAQLRDLTGVEAIGDTIMPALPGRLGDSDLKTLREAMSRHAGLVRDESGLKALLALIDSLEIKAPGALALISARLVAECALRRHESRGSHYRSDYPQTAAKGDRAFVMWADIAKSVNQGETPCLSPDCLTC